MCFDSAVLSEDSEKAGVPGNEIEIRPEMIEAGVNAYRPHWSDISECIDGASEKMVIEVFLAMFSLKPDRSKVR
jgi:hypothetical protein